MEHNMITLSQLKHGVLRRFIPAAAWFYFAVLVALSFATPGEVGLAQAVTALVEIASLAAGYTAILLTLRPRLHEDAEVHGSRSTLAGVLAPTLIGIFAVYSQGSAMTGIAVLSACAGVVIGLLLFLPWIQRPQAPPLGATHPQELSEDEEFLRLLSDGQQHDGIPVKPPGEIRVPKLAA